MRRILYHSGALIAFVAAGALLIAAGLPDRADYTGQFVGDLGYVAPEVGAIAPPFTQTTLSGKQANLLDLRGKTVIINFWATWCVPCRAEMPELQALHETDGVPVLAVNLGEAPEAIAAWVRELGLTFDIVLDARREIERLYRVRGYPATYIIAPDGTVRAVIFGATTADALRAHIP